MDKSIRVWDVERGFEAMEIEHNDPVVAVAFSPDGSWLASGCTDNVVRIYKIKTGTEVAAMRNPAGSTICSIALSPDGTLLAAASDGGRVGLWEFPTGIERGTIPPGDQLSVAAYDVVAFLPDGQKLVAGRADGKIEIWDVGSIRKVASLRGHSEGESFVGLKQVAVDPHGECLVSTGGIRDSTVRVWSMPDAEGESGKELAKFSEYSCSAVFSPDGRCLATVPGGVVKVRESGTWLEIATLPGHTAGINSLAWSRGGWLASGGGDSSIIVWK